MSACTVLRDALIVLALCPLAYYLVAIYASSRFFGDKFEAHPVGGADFAPAVSILKPIYGLDREAYENFASFCRQDYPDFEVLFCVADESDPARPVIEQIIRDFPTCSIRLLVGSEPLGASDKVNKLCRMAREAHHDVLIVSDSDVRVEAGFLHAVVAPFSDAQVGGVTCLYRGLTDSSFAADLEAIGNSADFAPGVLIAGLSGGLDFMLGAVMATTRKHLAAIGGFESLVDYFCDDYELGNRIAAKGYRVELSHFPVDIVYPHETIGEAFRHQVRWNLSVRYSRPWGHFGLIFTQGLFWTLAGIFLAHSGLGALGFIAGYALLRFDMALSVGARGMADKLVRRRLWMLPLRDAFSFIVWVVSFFPQRIHWRGREFYVRARRLVPIARSSHEAR